MKTHPTKKKYARMRTKLEIIREYSEGQSVTTLEVTGIQLVDPAKRNSETLQLIKKSGSGK